MSPVLADRSRVLPGRARRLVAVGGAGAVAGAVSHAAFVGGLHVILAAAVRREDELVVAFLLAAASSFLVLVATVPIGTLAAYGTLRLLRVRRALPTCLSSTVVLVVVWSALARWPAVWDRLLVVHVVTATVVLVLCDAVLTRLHRRAPRASP
ncbi:hypothetical protein [Aquipuribacter nitratireducens]|uniref:Uncharacterized protein n=1 Tax=Aquipuribacter nitratireducens TaxID=650104 RepID=A0ABW0GMI5_9MICO